MPAHSPLVCILMAAYNPGRFLAEALDSVRAQSYTNWLLLVLDDGSTDDTWRTLQDYAARDPRIRIHQNPQNLGFSPTRNRLLELLPTNASYVAVLDSDDVALPDRLANQLAALQARPTLGAVGSSLLIIDENSRVTASRPYPSTPEACRRCAVDINPLAHSTLMMTRQACDATGAYDTRLSCCEDYDYILRLMSSYDFTNLDTPQVKYRISSTQWKRRQVKRSIWMTLTVQRRYLFKFFTPASFVKHCLKYLLLLLPSSLILKLFYKMSYKPCN